MKLWLPLCCTRNASPNPAPIQSPTLPPRHRTRLDALSHLSTRWLAPPGPACPQHATGSLLVSCARKPGQSMSMCSTRNTDSQPSHKRKRDLKFAGVHHTATETRPARGPAHDDAVFKHAQARSQGLAGWPRTLPRGKDSCHRSGGLASLEVKKKGAGFSLGRGV